MNRPQFDMMVANILSMRKKPDWYKSLCYLKRNIVLTYVPSETKNKLLPDGIFECIPNFVLRDVIKIIVTGKVDTCEIYLPD